MAHKNRKQKAAIYQEKYGDIPLDYSERLSYLYDKLKLNLKICDNIIYQRQAMLSALEYKTFKAILYEEPEGTPRPRYRIINRKNLANAALSNGSFVHVYSLNAHDDQVFVQRMLGNNILELNEFICTPCMIDIYCYFKTPSYYNREKIVIAEMGLDRPPVKPDWDNMGKKYSDMYNSNVWLDDSYVTDGSVHKYYSILPRVEIYLKYLNMYYNKHQYNSALNKINKLNINGNLPIQELHYFGEENK